MTIPPRPSTYPGMAFIPAPAPPRPPINTPAGYPFPSIPKGATVSYGPTVTVPGPNLNFSPGSEKPLWMMNPQELQALAYKQAQDMYGPVLEEMARQEQLLRYRNVANSQALQQLMGAATDSARQLGQSSGRGDIFAQLSRQAVDELSSDTTREGQDALNDLLGKITDLRFRQGQDAQGILKDLYGQVDAHNQAATKAALPVRTYKFGNQVVGLFEDGTVKPLYTGPDQTKPASQTRLTFKNINGHEWGVDSFTGEKVVDLGVAGTPRSAASKRAAAAKVNLPLSRATGQWVDSSGNPVPGMKSIAPPGPRAGLAPLAPKTPEGVKPPSAATVRRGWKTITDSFPRSVGSGERLTPQKINQILAQVNKTRPKDKQITADMIPRMSPAQQRALGITGTQRNPQDVYLELVHSGIPARRAWTMVRKYYPGFGKGYFLPKVKGRVPDNPAGQNIVAEAQRWLGTPYSWGGGGPGGPSYGIGRGAKTKGFDCSGFIEYLYSKFGYQVGGTTYEQIKHGFKVDPANLAPGDLLFFGSWKDPHHVGMYIGGGKFIESPYTGGHIQISALSRRRDLLVAKRILGARV